MYNTVGSNFDLHDKFTVGTLHVQNPRICKLCIFQRFPATRFDGFHRKSAAHSGGKLTSALPVTYAQQGLQENYVHE